MLQFTDDTDLKAEQIPTLGPDDFGRKNFFGSTEVNDFSFPVNTYFHINRIEDHLDLIRTPMPPHRKSVYVFIFFTHGSCIRSKGLDTYLVADNTFFFLPAFQTTARRQQSLDSKGFYCQFNPDIFSRHFYQREVLKQFPFLEFIGDPTVRIDAKTLDPIVNILTRLEQAYTSHERLDLDLVSAYLLTLFRELLPFTQAGPRTTENAAYRITQEYKNALMLHIHDKQKITDFADLLSITPDYLNRCVKTTMGKTSHQLLDDMLILEAKVLLNQSSLNVSEVAYKLGKENLSDFIRFFKAKTGFTPKEYKQNRAAGRSDSAY